MRFNLKTVLALSIVAATYSSLAQATSWQDKLSSAASDLVTNSGSNQTAAGNNRTSNALSLGSISQLLGGGTKAVSSNSMSNVTGILEYCAKNNIVDNNVDSITSKLQDKLGIASTTSQSQPKSYSEGLQGLLTTGSNQKIDLKGLGNTEMGKKLKTKACDVVLNQGKKYLGM